MFSSRVPNPFAPNALSELRRRLEREGVAVSDLTQSNPTRVGLSYPAELLAPLADARALRYTPEPFGLPDARAAVAGDYVRRRTPVDADRIVLTASTSEAYALLFKLLCDPDDEVLIPQPSYPLFELLTQLEAVRAVPYRLEYHGAWSIDRSSLEQARTARTRAVLVVAPNNPTGSFMRCDDRDWLAGFCAQHGIAIISDEVFADYPLALRADSCVMTGETRALTFSLGGLSKSAGLPQVKLGWIGVSGPDGLVADSLARLELICDTYLSVSTPVQIAAPALIQSGASARAAILARVTRNLSSLRSRVTAFPAVTLFEPEGGWTAVLQVPATRTEEEWTLALLQDAHVFVHPGYFFDFPREAFLMVSLLPPPDMFDAAIDAVLVTVSEGRAS
jgi:alanine-synthesizing transaminase